MSEVDFEISRKFLVLLSVAPRQPAAPRRRRCHGVLLRPELGCGPGVVLVRVGEDAHGGAGLGAEVLGAVAGVIEGPLHPRIGVRLASAYLSFGYRWPCNPHARVTLYPGSYFII